LQQDIPVSRQNSIWRKVCAMQFCTSYRWHR